MKKRRTVRRPLAGSFLLLMVACGAARAQTPAPARNDYTNAANWLCRPGGPQTPDACTVDLAATVVAANGHLTREAWKASPNAPVDCFYVYPTVSADPTMNSDMSPGPEERRIVGSQAARFQSQCRVYAPIYRQISLVGLRANKFGPIDGSDLLAHGPATGPVAVAAASH